MSHITLTQSNALQVAESIHGQKRKDVYEKLNVPDSIYGELGLYWMTAGPIALGAIGASIFWGIFHLPPGLTAGASILAGGASAFLIYKTIQSVKYANELVDGKEVVTKIHKSKLLNYYLRKNEQELKKTFDLYGSGQYQSRYNFDSSLDHYFGTDTPKSLEELFA